jgi:hypothetical protein
VALLGLAPLAGGMLFFGAVMAPLVFQNLAPAVAGPFIRSAFPLFYGFVVVCATLSACGFLILGRMAEAALLFVIIAATYWSWFWQLPHLDALRLSGDTAAFTRGHEFSVWVYGAEMFSAFGILIRFALITP